MGNLRDRFEHTLSSMSSQESGKDVVSKTSEIRFAKDLPLFLTPVVSVVILRRLVAFGIAPGAIYIYFEHLIL
jgi:hypothetical protein